MPVVGDLVVLVKTDSRQFQRGMQRNTKLAKAFGSVMKKTLIGLGIGAAAGIGFGVKLAAQAEKAEAGFKVLLKSGKAAKELMQDLREFGRSSQGLLFNETEINAASKALLAAREPVVETLAMLSDISAITDIRLNELSSIFSKMKFGDLIQGEELNQLAERGLPIFEELATVLGVSSKEIRKMGSEGKIVFTDLRQAFANMTKEGGQFFGASAAIADTAAGKWKTLQKEVTSGLREIGTAIMDQIDMKELLTDMTALVRGLTTTVIPGITGVTRDLVAAATALRASMDFGNKQTGGGFNLLNTGLNPLASGFSGMVRESLQSQERQRRGGSALHQQAQVGVRGMPFGLQGATGSAARLSRGRASAAVPNAVPPPGLDELLSGFRNQMGMNRAAGGLGRMFSGASNMIGGGLARLTPQADAAGPMGLNTAVTAGSGEALRLAAMSQAQHQQEQVQAEQLTTQKSMAAIMQQLVTFFLGGGSSPTPKTEDETGVQ